MHPTLWCTSHPPFSNVGAAGNGGRRKLHFERTAGGEDFLAAQNVTTEVACICGYGRLPQQKKLSSPGLRRCTSVGLSDRMTIRTNTCGIRPVPFSLPAV